MEVPQRWRPKMKEMIKKVVSPWGAFIVGLVISLFLLPCLSGPYVVILGMLAAKTSFFKGFLYMIVYNLFLFCRCLLLFWQCILVCRPKKPRNWRKNKLRLLHLIAGVILVALGIVILFGWL